MGNCLADKDYLKCINRAPKPVSTHSCTCVMCVSTRVMCIVVGSKLDFYVKKNFKIML